MRTTALFDLPAVPAPQTAAAPRTPLPLGELPVSCVPAAYDREHLYSPSAAYIEDVDHRPGDAFDPLPKAPAGPEAFRAWWEVASAASPDYLGLVAGDDIELAHGSFTGMGVVVSTDRFGALVRIPLPSSAWSGKSYEYMYVTARNQFGRWYR